MGEARRVRIVMRLVLAEPLGEAQYAHRRHRDMVAAGDLLQQLGDLVAMNGGDRLQIGKVGHRAVVLDEDEALAVEARCRARARR